MKRLVMYQRRMLRAADCERHLTNQWGGSLTSIREVFMAEGICVGRKGIPFLLSQQYISRGSDSNSITSFPALLLFTSARRRQSRWVTYPYNQQNQGRAVVLPIQSARLSSSGLILTHFEYQGASHHRLQILYSGDQEGENSLKEYFTLLRKKIQKLSYVNSYKTLNRIVYLTVNKTTLNSYLCSLFLAIRP